MGESVSGKSNEDGNKKGVGAMVKVMVMTRASMRARVRASASARGTMVRLADEAPRAKRKRTAEMNEDDMVLGGGGGRQHNNQPSM